MWDWKLFHRMKQERKSKDNKRETAKIIRTRKTITENVLLNQAEWK